MVTRVLVLTGAVVTLMAWSLSAADAPAAPPAEGLLKKAEASLLGSPAAAPATSEMSYTDRVSYCLGLDTGSGMRQNVPFVNEDLVVKGLRDGLSGGKPQLSMDAQRQTMMEFRKQMMAKREEATAEREKKVEDWKKMAQVKGKQNKKEGVAFLKKNQKKEGVVTTESGLQYEVLKKAEGPKPNKTDVVKVLYKGTLIDGTEFDSSEKHGGEPAVFPLDQVIKGWTEALQLMPVGSKYKLYLPADLAYGEQGQPGSDIYPDTVLVFEVELLSAEPAPKE
ncbi:MAG: FKBP-type peptidyl-prolyl cis-trans isomerase [bacterium]|nr:FKBP-type peptidyl-prolyl cis-trans isomerase [bacterium]